ncbi:MAG: hypothetical protein IJZ04_01725 [Clostridia bacterium]|nr:hypothetical protein [Clostridia bacterium]
MLGKCFSIICGISVLYAFFCGNPNSISSGLFLGAAKSVNLVISLVGIMALWNGILNVLRDAGIIRALSKILRPILRFVFPSSFKNNIATEEITACISANMLGIANASTPLAIRAIEKMDSRTSTTASDDMITLAILGCCSFNLIPTTIIGIRTALGAEITDSLVVPVWICSGVCALLGVLLSRLLSKLSKASAK